MRKKILLRKSLLPIAAVILVVIIAAPVLASPPIATRTLPTSVNSGDIFDVAIEASGFGFAGQVLETLPAGFTYLSCIPDDIGVEQAGNTVKFTFLGDPASFTYKVKSPPIDTTTTYTFHGIVKDENKNEYPIEDDDITVTASTPPPETYILTIAADGSGSITPSVGSHTYGAETEVSISATPEAGWRFDNWSSNVAAPNSSSTTVTMDSNKRVTAYFSPSGGEPNDSVTYILTVTCEPCDGGSVTLSPTAKDNQYEAGTSVELTATPIKGYAFDSWSGDLSGSTNPLSITMDCAKNVTANFVLLR